MTTSDKPAPGMSCLCNDCGAVYLIPGGSRQPGEPFDPHDAVCPSKRGKPASVHPAPWQWITGNWGKECLRDANRKTILRSFGETGAFDTASPLVAELIRSAPEMQGLLREVHDTMQDGMRIMAPPEELRARIRVVLDRLDEARKAGG